VVNPGVFQIGPNTSAVECAGLAGGVTPSGDLSHVLLFRGSPADGGLATATGARVSLDELLRKADIRQNVMLQGTDILYVPPNGGARAGRSPSRACWSPVAQVLTSVAQVLILTLAR
jgi:protein involved in polysaccharide export with SLBB domain